MSHHYEKNRGLFWGLIIIIVGFLFLLDEFNLMDVGDLWPLIIIAVGVWMIIKARTPHSEKEWSSHGAGDQSCVTDTDQVYQTNTFGDINVTINSKNFKGGEVRTTFGDVKVDLTEINIKEGEQVLRLNNTFGDINISVPKDIPLLILGSNTAGDMKIFQQKRSGWRQTITHKSEGYETASQKLKIVANQVFGDLKVW